MQSSCNSCSLKLPKKLPKMSNNQGETRSLMPQYFSGFCTQGTKVPCSRQRLVQLKEQLFIIYLSIRKQLDVMIAICLINELIKTVKCLQRGTNALCKYFQKTGRRIPSQPSVNFN